MSYVINQTEAAAVFKAQRCERAEALWSRFRHGMERDGLRCPGKPPSVAGVARTIRSYLSQGMPSRWRWASALEFAEVCDQKGEPVPFLLCLRSPEPVDAMAGSDAKLDVLATRVANGQELFCAGDGPGVVVRGFEPDETEV